MIRETICETIRENLAPIDLVKEGLIVALWRTAGLDTYEIAKKLGVREWQVSNLLLHLRERACP
jgi:DNA-binding CsgD family transcriptional regulator